MVLSLIAGIHVTRKPEVLTVFTLSLDISDAWVRGYKIALCFYWRSRSIWPDSQPRATGRGVRTLGRYRSMELTGDRLPQSRSYPHRSRKYRSIRLRVSPQSDVWLIAATVATESVTRSHRVQARRRVSGNGRGLYRISRIDCANGGRRGGEGHYELE